MSPTLGHCADGLEEKWGPDHEGAERFGLLSQEHNHPWFINKGSTCVTLSSGGGAVGGGQELAKAGGS